jgi:hypothetical protein
MPSGPSRRRFLGGAAATVALPLLESLLPRTLRADPPPPKRLLFFYVPCGIHMPNWTPVTAGDDYVLTPILQPLAAVKNQILLMTGLANTPGRPEGAGDHAGGTSAFLTCTHVTKSESDIRCGVSVDQVAAKKLSAGTRFASLQFGIEGGSSVGGCDSGYSCAYTRNISWAGPNTPLQKTVSPQAAFDILFAGTDATASQADQQRRRRSRQSVLDHVLGEAQSLQGKLGQTDRRKLDEYLTGVREIELRLGSSQKVCIAGGRPAAELSYPEQVRLMNDMMVLSFQCDLTRVITFMLNNAATGRNYDFIGVSGAHHELSHHMGLQANFDKLTLIDTWEVQQLAYLLGRMNAISEGSGTMLDHSLVYFSSEIEDGNAHRHTNLPVLLAGKLGGAVRPGRHLAYHGDPPLGNLFMSILAAVGVTVDKFGDNGTAPLPGLV